MQAVPVLEPPSTAAFATLRIPIFGPTDLIGRVRRAMAGQDYESATDVAVVEGDHLLGLVTIERLFAAGERQTLAGVMDDTPPVTGPGIDQERAAWLMTQQNESSLAVVDGDGRFLGLVPPFRMLAVLLEEHAEDLSRLGGFLHDAASARTASAEPVRRRFWHRLPWLLVGLVGAMLAAGIVAAFEEDLSRQVLLAFFVPGIVYMADAVGTQTETLVIRGLSVGVSIRQMAKREVLTGPALGAALAAAFFVFALVAFGDLRVALAVSLALFTACSLANVVALVLPGLLAGLGRDPAYGSGPLATVVQDLLSLLVYFGFAALLVR